MALQPGVKRTSTGGEVDFDRGEVDFDRGEADFDRGLTAVVTQAADLKLDLFLLQGLRQVTSSWNVELDTT